MRRYFFVIHKLAMNVSSDTFSHEHNSLKLNNEFVLKIINSSSTLYASTKVRFTLYIVLDHQKNSIIFDNDGIAIIE